MRSLLLAGTIALASIAVPVVVLADGYAPRAVQPVRLQVSNWTGFYAGAHGGYGWGNGADATISPANAATAAFVGPAIATGAIPSDYSVDTDGFLGGLQVGYNLEFGSVVAGIEADISWMDMQESQTLAPTPIIVNNFATDINWLSTIRGRLGAVASPDLLLYATGGFAFADIDQSMSTLATNTGSGFAGSSSDTATGWTIGGGLEWVLSRHWTMKGEYMFVRLDPDDFSTSATSGNCSNVTNNCVVNVATDDIDLQIIRAGLNYRF